MDRRGRRKVILVSFHSVSAALFLEMLLKQRGVACSIIPVPREISSSCGYAAEVGMTDAATLKSILDDAEIEWETLYGKDAHYFVIEHAPS